MTWCRLVNNAEEYKLEYLNFIKELIFGINWIVLLVLGRLERGEAGIWYYSPWVSGCFRRFLEFKLESLQIINISEKTSNRTQVLIFLSFYFIRNYFEDPEVKFEIFNTPYFFTHDFFYRSKKCWKHSIFSDQIHYCPTTKKVNFIDFPEKWKFLCQLKFLSTILNILNLDQFNRTYSFFSVPQFLCRINKSIGELVQFKLSILFLRGSTMKFPTSYFWMGFSFISRSQS